MGGPTTPYARQAADISDSTTSGRTVLTGTPAQGAAALGLGPTNDVAFRDVTASRGDGTGVIFLNAAKDRYAYYNGSTYVFPGAGMAVGGALGVAAQAEFTTVSAAGYGLRTRADTSDAFASIQFTNNSGGADWSYIRASGPNVLSFQTSGGTERFRVDATGAQVTGSLQLGAYTVATVPAGVAGRMIFVSNARKVGEAAGAGTGVPACYSNGAWRRLSDDTAVAA